MLNSRFAEACGKVHNGKILFDLLLLCAHCQDLAICFHLMCNMLVDFANLFSIISKVFRDMALLKNESKAIVLITMAVKQVYIKGVRKSTVH